MLINSILYFRLLDPPQKKTPKIIAKESLCLTSTHNGLTCIGSIVFFFNKSCHV